MNKYIKVFDKTLSYISMAMVAILGIGVILTVFLRYFFSLSFGWFEEFLTMVFISIIFLGTAICIREKQHIGITIVVDRFAGIWRKVSIIFIQVMLVLVSVFLAIYSLKWIASVGSTPSPVSGIPFGKYYTIVPISSLISIGYSCINILSLFIPIEDAETGYFSDEDLLEECAQ